MQRASRTSTLLACGIMVVATHAAAADIPVAARKLIVIDKTATTGVSKVVYVAKDAAVTKTADDDAAAISATFNVTYLGALGSAAGQFDVPAGLSNGTDGWVVDKDTVAKYTNKDAPNGPTGTKVAVIKPAKLLKLVAKTRGDSAMLDVTGADAPIAGVFTAFTVTEASGTNVHCSEFPLGSCAYKVIAGGTGRKLSCKDGIGDAMCTAALPPPTSAVLELVVGAPGGTCGETRTGGPGGSILKTLICGGLSAGGGCFEDGPACGVAEAPSPVASRTQMKAECGDTACAILGRTAAETGSGDDCSAAGCQFGAWLSISNGGTSTCVRSTFTGPVTGDLDLTTGELTGSFPLSSAITMTGNGSEPCPPCVGGVCDASAANPGASCTAINAAGDSYECLPQGVALTPIAIDLTPIGTGTAAADTSGGDPGIFCPGQNDTEPGSRGCFGSGSADVCDYIEVRGSAAGPLSLGGGPAPATLASVFCIPATGDTLIDTVTDLPGPGALSLPGTLNLF
jgi:hypothetical protein